MKGPGSNHSSHRCRSSRRKLPSFCAPWSPQKRLVRRLRGRREPFPRNRRRVFPLTYVQITPEAKIAAHETCQTAENESLRARLKQYSDYDEIKRELEIMKVTISAFKSRRSLTKLPVSLSNLAAPTLTRTTMFIFPILMPMSRTRSLDVLSRIC